MSSLLASVPAAEQSLGRLKSVCKDRQLTRAEVFNPDFVPSLPPPPVLLGFAPQKGLKGLTHVPATAQPTELD